ncbi:MAG: hypothetical protein JST43_09000 [Bacteroidetes bacterium]|nr:hypothetical protein [Bacteroidota bacterium]MBS1539481.1 hypothetical protein [Bacteroidota bacterium]
MKITPIKVLSLALIFQFSSCDLFKKRDPKPLTELQKLPPATQTGKNTFGCLVNGKAFVPISSVDLAAVYQQGTPATHGNLYNSFRTIALTLNEKNHGLIRIQSYNLTRYPDHHGNATFQITSPTVCDYQPQNTFSGTMTINKIDRSVHIVSGEFEFSTITQNCDTLKINNGRLDIKYIP